MTRMTRRLKPSVVVAETPAAQLRNCMHTLTGTHTHTHTNAHVLKGGRSCDCARGTLVAVGQQKSVARSLVSWAPSVRYGISNDSATAAALSIGVQSRVRVLLLLPLCTSAASADDGDDDGDDDDGLLLWWEEGAVLQKQTRNRHAVHVCYVVGPKLLENPLVLVSTLLALPSLFDCCAGAGGSENWIHLN